MKTLVVQWLSLKEMDTVFRVQILDEAVCILQSANTLGKGMPLTILSFAVIRTD